jgi:site-specific DNA-cytosine methylase
MKTLELFCGTKSFSKVANNWGYETKTIDNQLHFRADITMDIMNFDVSVLDGYKPDIIWASPPCQSFSVTNIGKNWNKTWRSPKNRDSHHSKELVKKTLEIISIIKPKYFYIENPRAMLRKLDLIPYPFATVTYCQYGFTNMKPTDIWTNNDEWRKVAKSCKIGDTCHEPAPRGSQSGTQGIKGSANRGKIPRNLIEQILKYSL